jgi:hypothetical protein
MTSSGRLGRVFTRSAPLTGPYSEFQERIDDAFARDNPARSVPWGSSRPDWAAPFSPKTILDVGCAKARFTTSVLGRLGTWECLKDVKKIVLVESEPGFDANCPDAAEDIRRRCRDTLSRYGRKNVDVQLVNQPAVVERRLSIFGAQSKLSIATEMMPTADMIIASHITYYFASGGAEFIHALAGSLTRSGLIWLVVRKRDCPIYRERSQVLNKVYQSIDQRDYAEDMETIIQRSPNLELIDASDRDFLSLGERPSDCVDLAYLLMWRTASTGSMADPKFHAARKVCLAQEPLYSERHFIVRRKFA